MSAPSTPEPHDRSDATGRAAQQRRYSLNQEPWPVGTRVQRIVRYTV